MPHSTGGGALQSAPAEGRNWTAIFRVPAFLTQLPQKQTMSMVPCTGASLP